MKIYSSQKYELWNMIQRFVGKDVWVRCRHYREGTYVGEWFVRILGMANVYGNTSDFYSINAIDSCYIDDDYYTKADYIPQPNTVGNLKSALKPRVISVWDIDLVNPKNFDMYDTEEIVERISEILAKAGETL